LARTCSIGAHDGVPSGFRSERLFSCLAGDSIPRITNSHPCPRIACLLATSQLRSIMVPPFGVVNLCDVR